MRSWATWTSTVRSSPYQSVPQTPSSSCWRVQGEPDVVGQERQQVELAGRQRDDLSGPARLAAAQVHLEVAQGDHVLGRRALPRPPQDGPHPRHQLPRRERLDEVVVGPQLEPEDPVDLVVACGEEEDGHRTAGPDVAAHVEPVPGARKADIEDDDAGVLLREDLESFLSVAGQEHAETFPPQVEVHQIGDVRVVLDDDHRPAFRAHVPSLPSPAPRIAGMPDPLTEP